jgi:hypothetical protein
MPSEVPVAAGLFLASVFLTGLSAVVYNVNQVSFRQAITPLEMQGRMNATMRFVVWGTHSGGVSHRRPARLFPAAADDDRDRRGRGGDCIPVGPTSRPFDRSGRSRGTRPNRAE